MRSNSNRLSAIPLKFFAFRIAEAWIAISIKSTFRREILWCVYKFCVREFAILRENRKFPNKSVNFAPENEK